VGSNLALISKAIIFS